MMAGQILGVQMGYSLATLFDPQTKADTPVLAEFHRLAALLIFLQLDVHHWLLRAVVSSFAYLPGRSGPRPRSRPPAACCMPREESFWPGCRLPRPVWWPLWWRMSVWDFSAKASPQLPVLFIGLAVKNLAGLAMLIAVVAYWPQVSRSVSPTPIALGERLLHLAH